MPAEVALPSAAAQTEHPTLRAYLALLAGVLCIGFSAIFARYADAPGIVVAAWRVSTATLVLAIPFMRQPPARRLPRRASLGWALLGGALFAA
ncbi:MAG: hypothetical protein JW910_14220, partial [Anaerolineae bacterium]|nr:hypothetical protein [Anaerolineae bacterium]